MRKILLVGAIIVLALAIGGYKLKGNNFSGLFKNKTDIGQEAAKTKALDFVKNNLVQPGTDVTVKSISKEGDLYNIIFTVEKQDINAFMTQDGTKFFPQVLDIAETEKKNAASQQQLAAQNQDIPKTDKPAVDLYVMAFCPFGNKAEDTLKSAYNLLKNTVDFNFHYIVSTSGDTVQSLHGDKEVTQDEREACVLKNYSKDKWMDFATYVNDNCGSDGACWEAGAKSLSLDANKINTCVSSEGVALMKANEQASTEASAQGSPTMIINGVQTQAVYQYGNSEAYKQAICEAFNEAPAECSQVLGSESSAAQGGSCGN